MHGHVLRECRLLVSVSGILQNIVEDFLAHRRRVVSGSARQANQITGPSSGPCPGTWKTGPRCGAWRPNWHWSWPGPLSPRSLIEYAKYTDFVEAEGAYSIRGADGTNALLQASREKREHM